MHATPTLITPRLSREPLLEPLSAVMSALLQFGRRWAEAQAYRAHFE